MPDKESDLRGMAVFDWRWQPVGTVRDVWVDLGIKIIRILEVELHAGLAVGPVLVPIYHTIIYENSREVRVTALRFDQFADVPRPASPDQITGREDERLNAYFAAGNFYRRRPPSESGPVPPMPAPPMPAPPMPAPLMPVPTKELPL